MARDYNQQNADGSWWHVTQADDGSYSHTVIAPAGQAAAGIPAATSGADQSTATMLAGLDQAAGGHWNGDRTDPAAVAAAYAAAGAGGTGGPGYGYDPGAAALALQTANDAATHAYQMATLQGQSDRLAFDKATEAWTQTMQAANLTGTYNGQPTLAAKAQQDAADAQKNNEALGLMKLDASLSGPANAFDYAKTLTGTPGGLADIVRAAGGGYALPKTGGGNGAAPVPMTIQSIIDNINKYSPAGTPPVAGGTPAPPAAAGTPAAGGAPVGSYDTGNGVKTLAQMQAELKTANWGGNMNDPAAVAAAYASATGKPVTAGGATAGSYDTGNGVKTLAQMTAELQTANWGGNVNDPNAVIAAYAGVTGKPVTPSASAPAAPPATAPSATAPPAVTPPSPPAAAAQAPAMNQLIRTAAGAPAPAAVPAPSQSSGPVTSPIPPGAGLSPPPAGGASLAGTPPPSQSSGPVTTPIPTGAGLTPPLAGGASLPGATTAPVMNDLIRTAAGAPTASPNIVRVAPGYTPPPAAQRGPVVVGGPRPAGTVPLPGTGQAPTGLPAGTPPATPPIVAPPAGPVGGTGAGAPPAAPAAPAGTPADGMIPAYGPLPPPNQIDPQNWQNMTPSQQQLLMGAYKSQGYMQDDVIAQMTAGLKGYGGPQNGSVGF